MKQYYVYIMTNKRNTVLYTGVTNNMRRRVAEYKSKAAPGFTSRYNVNRLVYYEVFPTPMLAITREKQIKAGSRAAKERLIRSMNPEYKDLSI